MPRLSALPIAILALALAGVPARGQEPGQDPAKPVIRLKMNLDAVLPLLDTAVIRVRTGSLTSCPSLSPPGTWRGSHRPVA